MEADVISVVGTVALKKEIDKYMRDYNVINISLAMSDTVYKDGSYTAITMYDERNK